MSAEAHISGAACWTSAEVCAARHAASCVSCQSRRASTGSSAASAASAATATAVVAPCPAVTAASSEARFTDWSVGSVHRVVTMMRAPALSAARVSPACSTYRLSSDWQAMKATRRGRGHSSEDYAERMLERLVDAQLLETSAPGTYRMGDLLRLYARERFAGLHEA